jgi:hypothetical protein
MTALLERVEEGRTDYTFDEAVSVASAKLHEWCAGEGSMGDYWEIDALATTAAYNAIGNYMSMASLVKILSTCDDIDFLATNESAPRKDTLYQMTAAIVTRLIAKGCRGTVADIAMDHFGDDIVPTLIQTVELARAWDGLQLSDPIRPDFYEQAEGFLAGSDMSSRFPHYGYEVSVQLDRLQTWSGRAQVLALREELGLDDGALQDFLKRLENVCAVLSALQKTGRVELLRDLEVPANWSPAP